MTITLEDLKALHAGNLGEQRASLKRLEGQDVLGAAIALIERRDGVIRILERDVAEAQNENTWLKRRIHEEKTKVTTLEGLNDDLLRRLDERQERAIHPDAIHQEGRA